MAKTSAASSMANRLDQGENTNRYASSITPYCGCVILFFFAELMGKVSQSHSAMSDMGPPPVEYPPSSQMMSAPPPGHAHPNAAMMYPHYTPMPQRKW